MRPSSQAPAAAGSNVELAQHSRAVLASFPVVDVVAPDARVLRDSDGYYTLKSSEKAGNPFEKVRRRWRPMNARGTAACARAQTARAACSR